MYKKTAKSTVFGENTKFGMQTPFKIPSDESKSLSSYLLQLAVQLYPTGRAFYMLKESIKEKLHNAINISFIRFIDDANFTIDSCFPDNDNFSIEDCRLWEYRLGMISNEALDTQIRKEAIKRRMSRGRNVKARQHINYLQYQLQSAGFDVYLHENGFIESGVLVYKKPQEILYLQPENVQHGGTTQHGIGVQHGGVNAEVIANSYKPNEIYSVADENLYATFFIGGETLGASTEVALNRQEEFRELVLKLKPAHLVAFTFINYV
jgi:hypothetical protein